MSVSEISKDSVFQRALRENALTGMMLIVSMMLFANGIIIGIATTQIIEMGKKYEQMQTAWETSSTWHSMVSAKLNERGIEVPEEDEE